MKKLLVLCLLLCLVGCSSNDSKVRVGVVQLLNHDALNKATQGFVDVVDGEFGENTCDVKIAGGESWQCGNIASVFLADNVDLIMCNATSALVITSQATKDVPILGTSVTDYEDALGVIPSNVSGTSDKAPLNEQAQMLIDLLPNAKNIGILYCSSESNSEYQVEIVEDYLKAKGLNVIRFGFVDTDNLPSTLESACTNSDALFIPTDNKCADNASSIKKIADEYKVPIIAGEESIFKDVGGLATLSINYYELGRKTGEMAIRILKGKEKISDMEIEYDTKLSKFYSKEVAEKYNVTIPADFVEIGE